MFRASNPRAREPGPGLSRFDFGTIKVPVLIVHHREDACPVSPYGDAASLARMFPLISVTGGQPPTSDACEPMSPHGYLGRETETVDAIVNWMLKRPTRARFRASRRLTRQLPPQPLADGAAHDQLLVPGGQPGHLLREHGHALLPRARHARDVRAPEHPLGAEGVVER